MGSFNVGCGLSGISINEGDKVAFLVLGPAGEGNHTSIPQSERGKAVTIGTSAYYTPYLPPVYGEYDSYGGIKKVKPSGVTAALEEIFARPAASVLNAIGSDRRLYDTYSGVNELYMVETARSALKGYSASSETVLLAMGFTKLEPEEGFVEAYDYAGYRLQKEEDAAFHGGVSYLWTLDHPETGESYFRRKQQLNGMNETLNDFFKATRLLPGYLPEDWARATRLQSLNGMYVHAGVEEEAKEAYLQDKWEREEFENSKERISKLHQELQDDLAHAFFSPRMDSLLRSFSIRESEFAPFARHVTVNEVLEELLLNRCMMAGNRFYQPSIYASQDGVPQYTAALGEIITKYSKLHLSRYADEDEDEDFEDGVAEKEEIAGFEPELLKGGTS